MHNYCCKLGNACTNIYVYCMRFIIAVLDSDYSFPNGFDVAIPAGSLSGTLGITVLDDDCLEFDHSFEVGIASLSIELNTSPAVQTVSIIDDDGTFI